MEFLENYPTDKLIPYARNSRTHNDEQIAQINKTRKLPPNAKFVPNAVGQYRIVNNFINLTVGTQTLPEGFEVKKNILGQAVVLPKGSDGLFIK